MKLSLYSISLLAVLASPAGAGTVGAKVAFLDRVPVRVMGLVEAGDLLVPSGRDDGTAVATGAEDLLPQNARLVIGRALEDSKRHREREFFDSQRSCRSD